MSVCFGLFVCAKVIVVRKVRVKIVVSSFIGMNCIAIVIKNILQPCPAARKALHIDTAGEVLYTSII